MKNLYIIFFFAFSVLVVSVTCFSQNAPGVSPYLKVGTIVLLDRYFNSEKRLDSTGSMQFWHYTWEEQSDPGFHALGTIFKQNGASLASLDHSPRTKDLEKAGIYIIVDPDHIKDNPKPNYITKEEAKTISNWVRNGGVLVLLANDSANCDLIHFNQLSALFGIVFDNKSTNLVNDDQFETGAVIPLDTSIFRSNYKMFLKDVSVLNIKRPATPVASKNGEVLMAIAKFGKGYVFAAGDPWLYDEYVVGHRLPESYQNKQAAEDLVRWLVKQSLTK